MLVHAEPVGLNELSCRRLRQIVIPAVIPVYLLPARGPLYLDALEAVFDHASLSQTTVSWVPSSIFMNWRVL